jgi:thioredoxin 1
MPNGSWNRWVIEEDGEVTDVVIQVNEQTFKEEVLGADRAVLVDFWAEWCVPCHMLSPIVEEIARDHADLLRAAKLNVDDNPDIALECGVLSIPTLILFKDGEEKARVVGAKGKEAILREIEAYLAA